MERGYFSNWGRPFMSEEIRILVDADSCPVKEEVYKVALRHEVLVSIVANSYMNVSRSSLVELIVVGSDFDAADDYIAERASQTTVVVTADILLADRCLKTEATVIAPNGVLFTPNSIGGAVATRAIMEDLRAGGEQHGGPPPFSKTDRSRFLSALHDALVKLKRN
jgi:hypothetical protein